MKLRLRLAMAFAIVLVLVISLVGCGGSTIPEEGAGSNNRTNTNGNTGTADPAPAAGNEAGAGGDHEAEPEQGSEPGQPATRTVSTLAGEVDIPADPQRILLTYDDDTDHLLALGLKPVAIPLYQRTDNIDGYIPYLADQLQGVTTYPLSAEFEPILAAEPDLIVAGYHHRDYLDALQQIAPTIYFDWVVDWRITHLEMGRVLGLEDKAQANVDAFNAELEKTKAYLAEAIGEEPVAFFRVRQNQLELYGGPGTGSSASFILYDLLGLTPVEEAPADTWGKPFSLETFTDLKAEHIFLLVQESDENNALVDALLAEDLYKNVPAIQKNQIYKVSSYPWERGGPIGFTLGMQHIREMVKP